jgi:hypothetical protein
MTTVATPKAKQGIPCSRNRTDTRRSPSWAQSQEAFYRDLPELLRTYCKQWVAYHGDERIGFARSKTELYERCLRRGFKEDEFIVLFADHAALADHEEIDLPLNP